MNFFKPKFWDKTEFSLFSLFLYPITLIIKLLTLFRPLLAKKNQCSIPVICVGNIYLGGTGKTPLSIEIYSILKNLNMNPAFIRKKYLSFQDEVELQKQTGPVYQNKKRIEAIKEAIRNNIDVAILDDGFQDFSIDKDLSVVCFNENQWIGNGLTIPSGPLRENLSSLKRTNLVFINGEKNTDIESKIYNKNKEIKIYYAKYKPTNINEFKNKSVLAFAGIGNPANFFDLLKKNNINIIEEKKFPDHHNYSEKELDDLINKAKEKNSILLTTEKDYFRINKEYKKNINFLRIKVEIENKDDFVKEIKKII
ncbi:tetraacyldisaccharide 4'-kinase [Pelagibacteraceae bacterium]|nr:tetraacyldisaccharide 4'-kinase [Pelagibacteraceae bacterium]